MAITKVKHTLGYKQMNDTTVQLSMKSYSPEETEEMAASIGRRLKGGEVIELVSDLGGGKTTFVRGLARGAGSKDHVSSPTFTVNKIYKTPKLTICHFDFYKLEEPGLMGHEIQEALDDPEKVVIIEWGKIVRTILPEQRVTIELRHIDESSRTVKFRQTNSLNYLIDVKYKQ